MGHADGFLGGVAGFLGAEVGWCNDMDGRRQEKYVYGLPKASSPEECLSNCKNKQEDMNSQPGENRRVRGCEYQQSGVFKGQCQYHTYLVGSGNGDSDYLCWIFNSGNT